MISFGGLIYRTVAICHKIRHPRHKLLWKDDKDELNKGNIICETCNVCFWCRAVEVSKKELDRIADKED